MIPPTLDAFRALMNRARAVAVERKDFDAYALAALATATPAQLLGIVGDVEHEVVERPDYYGRTGRLIVTPREDT